LCQFASNKETGHVGRTLDPLDVMVGAKIRIFRSHRGMSQTDLAGKIGVAFRQVQKYEKGINRVGASRLLRIAAVLRISIADLFETVDDKSGDAKSPSGCWPTGMRCGFSKPFPEFWIRACDVRLPNWLKPPATKSGPERPHWGNRGV
jgi:transcriptional regulator with XRE-family HTH domain